MGMDNKNLLTEILILDNTNKVGLMEMVNINGVQEDITKEIFQKVLDKA